MRRFVAVLAGVSILGIASVQAAITVIGVPPAPAQTNEAAANEPLPVEPPQNAPTLQTAGCPVFPADNIWNRPIDDLPVHPNSAAFVAAIGADANLQADFGAGLYDGQPIGVPYAVVPFGQPPVPIHFVGYDNEPEGIPEESDPGPYPIPRDAPIEGGIDGTSDRHVIVIQQGSCTLFELYKAVPNPDGSWNAVSSAKFDLAGNELRIEGHTSTDAAGLPVFPGLVRYDEVAAGAINHALRFTAPDTAPRYVWPARHFASHSGNPNLAPMGQRFRLRADFDTSDFSKANQVILTALKTYGMMLADNGSPWFLTGAPDARWDNEDISELRQLKGKDFEAVEVAGLIVGPDSGAALQPNMPRPRPN